MPAVAVDPGHGPAQGRGLTKPKSKLRLRLGLTPPHASKKKQATASPSPAPAPAPPAVPPTALVSSTSTTATGTSRTDSRSAFTFDNHSTLSLQSPGFETVSLNTEHANASRSTLMDPNLAQHYYPTPSATASTSGAEGEGDSEEVEDDAGFRHPHLRELVAAADDIFCLTDRQLGERFSFIEEIGFGNWGSVWRVRPRHSRASQLGSIDHGKPGSKMGRKAAMSGGSGAGGKVAIKLVHRERTAVTAARVRALWGEMKIIRQLRAEPHPSIIQFEAFVITESFALVIMPYLSHLIPVCLSPERATPYFRQLCSAVGYLHERGITHNDIKPANVMLSYNDVPVLVDFGFANKWPMGERGSFLNDISWGTPEYLDPQRAKGLPHDERASDVWSLGITLYEILIGRTPFEENEEEDFQEPEQYLVYYERTRQGAWLGEYSMPDDLQHLIRSMVCPDPSYRITAMQAYHHPALQPAAPAVIITPHFVRAATAVDEDPEPLPPIPYADEQLQQHNNKKKVKGTTKDKDKDTKKSKNREHATPTALGESIRQHTSAPPKKPHAHAGKGKGKGKERVEEASPSKKASKLVIKNTKELRYSGAKVDEEDPTPTKVTKPAQPLRIKELVPAAGGGGPLRTSASESRPASSQLAPTPTAANNRDSIISSTSTVPAANKEEAMLKTMSSLEGKRLRKTASSRDVLGKITRAAPKPPATATATATATASGEGGRPTSTVSLVTPSEPRRSMAMERVDEEKAEEDAEAKCTTAAINIEQAPTVERVSVEVTLSPTRPAPAPASKRESLASPPRQRRGIKPDDIVIAEEQAEAAAAAEAEEELARPTLPTARADSPLAQPRQKILDSDQEQAVQYRKVSGDLMRPSMATLKDTEPARVVTGKPLIASLSRTKSVEALALDTRLDKLSEWVKGVEHIIGEAKKALAEGREPPLPLLTLPSELSSQHPELQEIQHQFGLTPKGKDAVPAHLRTSSTQVEPATPPKWMTYAEAEERVKLANQAWSSGDRGSGSAGASGSGGGAEAGQAAAPGLMFKKNKKERPTVSHVMKLFGQGAADKDKITEHRSSTPEPSLTVPLKPPALRGVPSTPALRGSSTTRNVPQRKSESNLRGSRQFNTMPTLHSVSPDSGAKHPYAHGAESKSPPASSHPFATKQRGVYEQLLESHPGVVRQGEGWSSRPDLVNGLAAPPPIGGRMGKTSSMLSLREKARAWMNPSSSTHPEPATTTHATTDIGSKRESRGGNKTVQWSASTTSPPGESAAQRPGTPGAASTLSMKKKNGGGAGGGIFKAFKWGK